MKDALEAAVKVMAEKAKAETTADYAMKFAQAALNLTHALATLANIPRQST